MNNFSQKLKDRLIDYFKQYYGLEISQEQADEYLNSLADLYLAFTPKDDLLT